MILPAALVRVGCYGIDRLIDPVSGLSETESMTRSEQIDLSRRQFLGAWAAFLAGGGVLNDGAFGAVSPSGGEAGDPVLDDEIQAEALQAAESLMGLAFSPSERSQLIPGLKRQREQYKRRRERGYFGNEAAPALVFNPVLPGHSLRNQVDRVTLSSQAIPPLPTDDAGVAFAPVTQLSVWLREQRLTSERLTRIYIERLKRFDPRLHCVVTLLEEEALEQARRADREIRAGQWRGPLHGIPWGAKDLFDTVAGRTTWGATPYQTRRASEDAYVVRRLEEAGAVLVAKLTLGALAMGDVWFADVTRNPFKPEQGSSGSSAGSASATAAGLVGFSLGTETLGSIVSPCMRCGTTGLRPTFGRVARTGAMALCWSLDKIGPICRTVEDTALVLAAINGADDGDASSVQHGFEYDGRADLSGFRVGYRAEWFEGDDAMLEREALRQLEALGVSLVPVEIPDEPFGVLYNILNVEAAAAFEELTLTGKDDLLVRQTSGSWPNSFRRSWFVPAIEYVQADRFRRQVMEHLERIFDEVDVLFSPSFAGSLLVMTNFTGHPSLTLRAGIREDGTPTGVTLWGRLFEEGSLCRLGSALEARLGVWERRPRLAN